MWNQWVSGAVFIPVDQLQLRHGLQRLTPMMHKASFVSLRCCRCLLSPVIRPPPPSIDFLGSLICQLHIFNTNDISVCVGILRTCSVLCDVSVLTSHTITTTQAMTGMKVRSIGVLVDQLYSQPSSWLPARKKMLLEKFSDYSYTLDIWSGGHSNSLGPYWTSRRGFWWASSLHCLR